MKKIIALTLMLFAMSFSTFAQTTYSRDPKPECLGVELDGSQTLRVYGEGKNKKDAVEQARKNAVYAVVFNGIKSGKGGCNTRPLMPMQNAHEKFEHYFNNFFRDGGEYANYVTKQDEKRWSKAKSTNKLYKSYTITVRVLRGELKQRLIMDGLIKE